MAETVDDILRDCGDAAREDIKAFSLVRLVRLARLARYSGLTT
jgi:hypothetical protein